MGVEEEEGRGVEEEEGEEVRIKVMRTRVYLKAAAEDKKASYLETKLEVCY